MLSQPPEITGSPATYYSCGWAVRPLGGGTYNLWHFGYGPGSFAESVRRADGFCWAALFNRFDWTELVPNYFNIDGEMNAAINSVTTWPTNDPFDANNDGILDAWQIHYFGSTSSPGAAPYADPDHDGANNLNEYINQTDPADPASAEKLRVNRDPLNNLNLVLSWFAARGRLYTIESATGLSSPNWQALAGATDIVGDNTMRSITNSVSGTAFYRLRTRLQRL
jgi:hypothetical protein